MTKTEREELRKECNRKISDGAWSYDTGNVLNLLDALDEKDERIAAYKRNSDDMQLRHIRKLDEANKRIAEMEGRLTNYEAKEQRVAEAIEVLRINES